MTALYKAKEMLNDSIEHSPARELGRVVRARGGGIYNKRAVLAV